MIKPFSAGKQNKKRYGNDRFNLLFFSKPFYLYLNLYFPPVKEGIFLSNAFSLRFNSPNLSAPNLDPPATTFPCYLKTLRYILVNKREWDEVENLNMAIRISIYKIYNSVVQK